MHPKWIQEGGLNSPEPGIKPDGASPSRKKIRLGSTEGAAAVGAWASRWEIAGLIEEGAAASDILEAIQSGFEEANPLQMGLPDAASSSGDAMPHLPVPCCSQRGNVGF